MGRLQGRARREQVAQHGGAGGERQVGYDPKRPARQPDAPGVGMDDSHLAAVGEAAAEALGEPRVELDRDDASARGRAVGP